jgi:hypothetical protein
MQDDAHAAVLSKNVITDVDDPLLRQAIPVWDQGNLDHYTADALALRLALRNEPGLKRAINRYWNILDLEKNSEHHLVKSSYYELFERLYKALTQIEDREVANEKAEEDWDRDVENHRYAPSEEEDAEAPHAMSGQMFYSSLFELADTWCENIDVLEYIEFLELVLDFITFEDTVTFENVRGRRLKPWNQIGHLDVYAAKVELATERMDEGENKVFDALSEDFRDEFVEHMTHEQQRMFLQMNQKQRIDFMDADDAERLESMLELANQNLNRIDSEAFRQLSDKERQAYLAMTTAGKKVFLKVPTCTLAYTCCECACACRHSLLSFVCKSSSSCMRSRILFSSHSELVHSPARLSCTLPVRAPGQ